MLFSVLSFVTGILVVQQFSVLPDRFWFLILFFLSTALVFFRCWRMMFFVIGLLWAICFANIRLAEYLPESMQGQHIKVEGRVIGLPQYDERRVRFDFAVFTPEHNFPKKIRLSWFFPKREIKAGQNWQLTVKLKKPHGRVNPGGFNYERWLFTENIGATGYVRNTPQPKLLATAPLWQSFTHLRQMIEDKLRILPESIHNKGVIKALTIGDRHDISPRQWDVFRKTGTVHLLAISGLHIGLISGLAYFLALTTGIRLAIVSPQIFAAIFAIIVAVFYSALAGFSLPTQRSLLMLTIAMITLVGQRNMLPVNILALTLLAVLLFDPLAVLSSGFWLSFFAVVVIIFSLMGRLGKAGYWHSTIKIHWVTALGLSPLLLFYFQQVSIVAPLANFLTVPVISLFVVPLCLLAVIVMFLTPQLAENIFYIVDQVLQGLWFILSEMAEWPFAAMTVLSPPVYALPFALLGVLILLSPKGIPARWLGLILLLPMILVENKKPKAGEIVMTLLDVGQGLASVIETTNHVLVFDTGAKYSHQYNMGSAVVIPFLKSKAIEVVDTLIISHGDNDHMGGAEAISDQFKVNQLLTSVPERLGQDFPIQCQSGQSWVWDKVRFEVLSPTDSQFFDDNNNSCVLKVSSKQGSILFTGDIEKQAEQWLVNHYPQQLKSDILIAPHHGSKTSSSKVFLKQVNPSIILIPAGYRNRFSFPHQEVLERYEAINATWFNTADEGALIVEPNIDVFVVKSERSAQIKYWNN